MSALYLLVTLLAAALLLAMLRRPGSARALSVWALAALLPVLAALSAALAAQARAARVLSRTPVQAGAVTLTTAGQTRTVALTPQDAACVARALHLNAHVTVDTPDGPVNVQPGTRASGPLPDRATVDALSIRGLSCPHVRAQRR